MGELPWPVREYVDLLGDMATENAFWTCVAGFLVWLTVGSAMLLLYAAFRDPLLAVVCAGTPTAIWATGKAVGRWSDD